MKKTLMRRIAGCLAAVLFLLTLAGCSKEPAKAETAAPVDAPGYADLRETDTLVLYLISEYINIDRRKIDQFTAATDIEVEIVVILAEEYEERVGNELVSGSGPDVLFMDYLPDMDVDKAARNQSFLDLTNVLAEDPEFSYDDYIDGIFEAGQIGGRQYLVPVSFVPSIQMSSAQMLEQFGFRWDKVESTSDFLNEIARLTPNAQKHPSFTQMLYSVNSFEKLFGYSGIRLIDYETGEILPDEKALRDFLEAYQKYFPEDYDEAGYTYSSNGGDRELVSGKCAFWDTTSVTEIQSAMNLMQEQEHESVVHMVPSQDGSVVNMLQNHFAINVNSTNTMNAYQFIKFMLSETAQADQFTVTGMPICKETLRKSIYEGYAVYSDHGFTFYDYDRTALTTEEADALYALLTEADFARRESYMLFEMMKKSMLPYFQGEDSYKNCLNDLRSKLTFYLSE